MIGTILLEREEVAGMDLSGLDLRKINLFNVCCSKTGRYEGMYLAADFSDSWISEETFTSSKHNYDVTDIIYRQNRCFAYDGYTIKCHDLETGRVIITIPVDRTEIEAWDELTEEWMSHFLLDRHRSKVTLDGIMENDLDDFDLGKGYEDEEVYDLEEWINYHDANIHQGILIPHGIDDDKLYLFGYNDMNIARERWDKDAEAFSAAVKLASLGQQDTIEQIENNLEETRWPVRYYYDWIYCITWNPSLEFSSFHDIGFSYYDTRTGACILMTDYEALELRYLKQIRDEELKTVFEKPLINPNKPERKWQRYSKDWEANDIQPWTDTYNIYYYGTGEFGRIDRFPKDWEYKTKQFYYSPGVCVKNCCFVGAEFEGEITAVLRRSGAIL